MKVEMIDLEKFFDDKYRYIKNTGIGATGVITDNQMVVRFNESEENLYGEKYDYVGSHDEERIAIVRDIYGLDDVLDNGLDYFDPDIVLYDMNDDFKKILNEVVRVRFINNQSGNSIIIELPKVQNSLTSNQLEALAYLNKQVKKASQNLSTPIEVYAADCDYTNYAEETNSLEESIIPFLSNYIDNSYMMSMEDKNLIAKEEVNSFVYN